MAIKKQAKDEDEGGDDTDETKLNETGSVELASRTINYSSLFTIEGFISTCSHNAGRSAPDRQYFYVNKRPCEHAKLTKLVNEQFHQFNRSQYPMFVLNVTTHTENVDVNVTPDKLQMFIRHEAALMAIIKSSLVNMYSRLYTTVNVSDTSINQPSPKSQALMASFVIKQPAPSPLVHSKPLPDENVSPPAKSSTLPELKIVETRRPVVQPSPERVREVLSILSPSKTNQPEPVKTPPPLQPKRNREELSPPSEFLRERVLKQPKLSIDPTTGSPEILSPKRSDQATTRSPSNQRSRSKSPSDITNLLRKSRSPILAVKPIWGGLASESESSTGCSETTGSPFSLSEKKSMFQNRIGSPSSTREPPVASSSLISMDSSFADRIDLHMCNRKTGIIDSPEVTKSHRFVEHHLIDNDQNEG